MKRALRCCAQALVLAATLAGCALAPEAPITSSLLDALPAEVPRRAPSRLTLLVLPPEARPALDTREMAYSLRPHHLAYFARNQWAETPPQMLQPLLLRTLEATGAFAAVLGPPAGGGPTLGLRTEIVELVQDFSQEPPLLRLALRVRLSDESANRVLGTREIALTEAMRQKAPAAGVAAANLAVARALREVAAFVLATAP
jgi:cholesterol transport system auxiliary component